MTVSALRTIFIGAPASASWCQQPLRWPTPEPDAVLDYALDVSALLADIGGDPIIAALLAVSCWGPGELVPARLTVAGGLIIVWLGPGLAGRNYTVRIEAMTQGLRTFEWFVDLLIDPKRTAYPLLAPINPGFGAQLTWPGTAPAGALQDEAGNYLHDEAGNYLFADSGSPTPPAGALKDEAGNYLHDEAGNYLFADAAPGALTDEAGNLLHDEAGNSLVAT